MMNHTLIRKPRQSADWYVFMTPKGEFFFRCCETHLERIHN
ncbi:hypothetical protein J2W36_004676 [Variovorax ginsengisoli]|uniref:Uncharacterized protein n=1 Tax=Variovorax ginsengisoli TaxID=363844 RepID=A0ABT9SDH4_9BURK|nr:hypothetical protein [Variovorax ginsengisoli]